MASDRASLGARLGKRKWNHSESETSSTFQSDSHLSVAHSPKKGSYRSLADAATAEAGVGEITPSHISTAANSNATNLHLETSIQSTLAHKKTYRIRGIPFEYKISDLEQLLRSVLSLDGTRGTVQVRSMAICPDQKTKVATVNFKNPPLLSSDTNEWSFEIPDADGSDAEIDNDDDDDIIPKAPTITIDTHFKGITILRSFKNASEHKVDCIAISGLGGHAFGSFKERAGPHMWLRDSLPSDLPGARVILYGYDTQLYGSHTFQDLEALASPFRSDLATLALRDSFNTRSPTIPLIFIAHSLGGLVVKEAIIQMKRDKNYQALLGSIYGALFFGVPSQGMEITSLVPMVDGQPNPALLNSLGKESPILRIQCREFPEAFDGKDSEIVCFYETEMSPTAVRRGTDWKMEGPLSILVDSSSARHSRYWENEAHHCLALKRSHSELVKFSSNDEDYGRVLAVLKRMMPAAVSVIPQGIGAEVCLETASSCREQPEPNGAFTEEQKRACLESLSFEQIDARLLNIKKAHDRTCKWLFEQLEYKNWLNRGLTSEHHGFLWIKGKPGAGKSTMMKYALLTAKKTLAGATIISFFFNARGSILEKSTLGMYRSLLFQLLTAIAALQDVFVPIFLVKRNHDDAYEWNVEELQEFLITAVEELQPHRLVCFIDALDECGENEAREMVEFLERLAEIAVSSGTSLNICLSSRPYPHISIQKGILLTVEGQGGHDKDIATYVQSKFKARGGKQTDDIKAEILNRASGVFLWVVLVVQMLNKAYDHGQIHTLRRRLNEIPDKLDDLFTDILMRDAETRDESVLCLQWLLFAQRPLKREELYFAILSGTEPTALGKWDPAEVNSQEIDRFILSCSKGLAEVSKAKDQTVQFIHESVRDFFLLRNGLAKLQTDLAVNMVGLSQERLKRCCYQYIVTDMFEHLSTDALPSAKSQAAKDLRKSLSETFPYLEYAVHNIFSHANAAQGSDVSQKEFLKEFESLNNSKMRKWIIFDSIFQQHGIRRYTLEAKLLYILSEQNLLALVQALLDDKADVCARGEQYGTAIQAASVNGHGRIVRLLIDAGADVNVMGGEYSRPLAAAMVRNHEAVVKLLLENGAALNANKHGQTPLNWAARNGHKDIVQLLLANPKVDPNSKDKDGQTPLNWAARNGHEATVRLLLANPKVDLDFKDWDGQTPLSWAACNGHEAVVRLLLASPKVDPDSKDKDGQTPLSRAVFNSQYGRPKAVVKYPCTNCDKRYEEKAGVERHMKSVMSRGWNFPCDGCGKIQWPAKSASATRKHSLALPRCFGDELSPMRLCPSNYSREVIGAFYRALQYHSCATRRKPQDLAHPTTALSNNVMRFS